MLRRILAPSTAAAAAVLVVPLAAQAAGMEKAIIVDAPDVQKFNTTEVPGFRTSDVVGQDVYSNAGKRIGEVEDFMMSSSGYFYAVVDIEEGPLEPYLDVTEDDVVVIPWDQLRRGSQDQASR